jgi:predicted Zn-dependent peptidase
MRSGAYRNPVDAFRSLVHGSFMPSFATSDAEFAKAGREHILKLAKQFREDPIPDQLFEACRTYPIKERLNYGRCDSFTLLENVVKAVCNGDPDLGHYQGFVERMQRLTPRRITEVARKYLTDEHVCVMLKPE